MQHSTTSALSKKGGLAIAAAVAVAALPSTAAAYSQKTDKSVNVAAAGSATLVNAGLKVGGVEWRDSSSTFAKAESYQGANAWVRLKGKTYTESTLEARAYGRVNWSSGNNPKYVKYALNKGTLFGKTEIALANGTCAETTTCTMDFKKTVSMPFIDGFEVFGASLLGISIKLDASLSGSAGYAFDAKGTALTNSSIHSFLQSSTKTGAHATFVLTPRFKASAFGLVSGSVSASIDIGKLSTEAKAENAVLYWSRNDMDVGWNNEAPMVFTSLGGKVVAAGCLPGNVCGSVDVFTWKAINSNKTWYKVNGSTHNLTAF